MFIYLCLCSAIVFYLEVIIRNRFANSAVVLNPKLFDKLLRNLLSTRWDPLAKNPYIVVVQFHYLKRNCRSWTIHFTSTYLFHLPTTFHIISDRNKYFLACRRYENAKIFSVLLKRTHLSESKIISEQNTCYNSMSNLHNFITFHISLIFRMFSIDDTKQCYAPPKKYDTL